METAVPSSTSAQITLTVFFEGTANTLDSYITQIGLFAGLTDAIDLSGKQDVTFYNPNNQYKICFDGYVGRFICNIHFLWQLYATNQT
jgi:hypothetical protein